MRHCSFYVPERLAHHFHNRCSIELGVGIAAINAPFCIGSHVIATPPKQHRTRRALKEGITALLNHHIFMVCNTQCDGFLYTKSVCMNCCGIEIIYAEEMYVA